MDRDRVGSDTSQRSSQRRTGANVAGRLGRALDVRTLTQREVDRVLAELRKKAQRRRCDGE